MRSLRNQLVCTLLAAVLALPSAGWAQTGLSIAVVAGEGGVNDIDQRTVIDPVVEVRDAQGQPVPGAIVTFQSPSAGPSVLFYGASRKVDVTTDSAGRAAIANMISNTDAGSFPIYITAVHGGQTAETVIHQSNAVTAQAPVKKKKWGWKVLTLVGAGVAAGIIAPLAISNDSNRLPTTTALGAGRTQR